MSSGPGRQQLLVLVAAFLVVAVLGGEAPAARPPAVRLETVRAGRHAGYASIVLQFNGPTDVDRLTQTDGRLCFVLKNVASDLARHRRYTSFNGFLDLAPAGTDLAVTIGLAPDFKGHRLAWLEAPRRLVVYLYPQAPSGPNRLIDIWGGVRAGAPVIALTFTDPIAVPTAVHEAGSLSFTLTGTVTDLAPRRTYRSFGGSLELAPNGGDLVVRVLGSPNEREVHLTATPASRRLEIVFAAAKTDPAADPAAGQVVGPVDQQVAERGPAGASGKTALDPAQPARPAFDPRQIGLIQARIMARKGLVAKSLDHYRDLRRRYPGDEEVWADYAETLIDDGRTEQAGVELDALLVRFPLSLRGRRLQARLLHETGHYGEAIAVLEAMGAQYPEDAGLWSDAAFACQDAGRWDLALNHFSRVLEIDPDNQIARQNIHDILKVHRPRLDAGYRLYELKESRTRTQTYRLALTRHLAVNTVVEAAGETMTFTRPEQAGAARLDRHLETLGFGLTHSFNARWRAHGQIGAYEGAGNGNWAGVGLSRKTNHFGEMGIDVAWHKPWTDPVEAVERQGRFDRFKLNWAFSPATDWNLFLEGAREDYAAVRRPLGEDPVDYGRKRFFAGYLSRTLVHKPELSVTYGFYRSVFDYDDLNDTAIGMLTSESVHSLSAGLQVRPCTYWTILLNGGVRYDTSRDLDSWFILPGVRLRMGNRIESDLTYELSSESGQATGGKTETFAGTARVIF